ncbi:glycosyltransferase family 2 protein [Pseudoalteromonas sp. T1lg88]|uniref:glycosyltransferase family 2 protein n=1 Tax=Pseudoalteromonas sp. T1lg88 TaxID=2077104 RepID=UPI000CF660A2|nr:glycosyltransferase family 2 protein [Pseudoalteromonas sp. T1lg88]
MSLVSIIMPCYNAEKTIERAINSVIQQTYSNWELIIVNDCSSDNSANIVKKFDDPRVHFFNNKSNSGAGVSRNKAIEKASGRFIAFLDADDYWHRDKLIKQINFMLENNYAFTYHAYQKFNVSGQRGVVYSPESATYKQLLKTNYIGCLTAIYDTDILGKIYMPKIRKRQDYALWLSILKTGVVAKGLPDVLAYYSTDTGMTKNKFKIIKSQWFFYRSHLNLNVFLSFYLLMHYALHGFIKYLR